MKMNIYLFIIGLAILIISFYPSFNRLGKSRVKVSKIILYNTIGESINEKDVTFQVLKRFPYKEITNSTTIDIINRAISINQSYIWKGHMEN